MILVQIVLKIQQHVIKGKVELKTVKGHKKVFPREGSWRHLYKG